MTNSVVYASFLATLLDGTTPTDVVDFINEDMKIAMLTSAYTPDVSNDEYWSDISANEASGTNYTAGGFALTNKEAIVGDSGTIYSADNISVSSLTIPEIRYLVLYQDTGVPTTSKLVQYWDIGSQALTSKPFTANVSQGYIQIRT